jgi:hypothetical protein
MNGADMNWREECAGRLAGGDRDDPMFSAARLHGNC